jgi:HNH endonuclease/AP2 domain
MFALVLQMFKGFFFGAIMEITQEFLNEIFEYKDGNLFWKVDRGNNKVKGKKANKTKKSNGYQEVKIHSKGYYAHRVIFMMIHGRWPEQIDHIDGDRSNNLLSNLREANNAQNNRNTKLRSTNTSGFKGVSFYKSANRYIAKITVNYQSIHLGCFKTPEEAHDVYKQAALKLHGDFAKFN